MEACRDEVWCPLSRGEGYSCFAEFTPCGNGFGLLEQTCDTAMELQVLREHSLQISFKVSGAVVYVANTQYTNISRSLSLASIHSVQLMFWNDFITAFVSLLTKKLDLK